MDEEPCRTTVPPAADRHWLGSNRTELALKLYRHLLAERFLTETGSKRHCQSKWV